MGTTKTKLSDEEEVIQAVVEDVAENILDQFLRSCTLENAMDDLIDELTEHEEREWAKDNPEPEFPLDDRRYSIRRAEYDAAIAEWDKQKRGFEDIRAEWESGITENVVALMIATEVVEELLRRVAKGE